MARYESATRRHRRYPTAGWTVHQRSFTTSEIQYRFCRPLRRTSQPSCRHPLCSRQMGNQTRSGGRVGSRCPQLLSLGQARRQHHDHADKCSCRLPGDQRNQSKSPKFLPSMQRASTGHGGKGNTAIFPVSCSGQRNGTRVHIPPALHHPCFHDNSGQFQARKHSPARSWHRPELRLHTPVVTV